MSLAGTQRYCAANIQTWGHDTYDGNSEHVAHVWMKICLIGFVHIRFVTDLDQYISRETKNKIRQDNKKTRSLHTCAPLSELPSNINTMAEVGTSINWLDWYYDKQYLYSLARVQYMVLILDGNSEHVAHAWRKIGSFEKKKKKICHRSYQMPWLVQLTKISPYVRTHFSKLP